MLKTVKGTALLALILGVAFILSLLPLTQISQAATPRKVILLLMDGLSLRDIEAARAPRLKGLIKKGALGLMNARTARGAKGLDRSSGYLTIGSGARAKASGGTKVDLGGLAFNAQEMQDEFPVSQVFYRQTGLKTSPTSIVHLGVADILRQNAELPYTILPGALGEAMKRAKLRVAVLGNADTNEELHREVALVGMDRQGKIKQGNVGPDLLEKDPLSPFGVRTNYARLLSQARDFLRSNDLLVVDLGDTARVNFYTSYSTDAVLERQRQAAIERADDFIGKLLSDLDLKQTLFIVATPSPSWVAYNQGIELTPIIVARGGFQPGVLSSATTRWPGIVVNIDLAPTILDFFGAEIPYTMPGRPLVSVAERSPFSSLHSQNSKLVAVSNARQPILTFYVVFIVTILILAMVALLLPPSAQMRKPLQTLKALLLWTLAVPATLLLVSMFPAATPASIFLIFLTVSALATLSFVKLGGHSVGSIAYLCLVSTGLIFLDVLTGSTLMGSSLLGHSPLIGARFYGIGNEYIGVLIGASIAGLTTLRDTRFFAGRFYLRLVAVIFLLLIFIVGSPAFGANVGGTIAAVAAFAITYAKLSQQKVSLKSALIVMLAIFVVLAAIVAFDFLRALSASHVGRAFFLIKTGGYQEGFKIIQRKIAMNIRLIQFTIWSKVLIASLAAFAFLAVRPAGIQKKVSLHYPNLSSGLAGIITGSIVALIFNDSGVVAAATTIIFAAATLLYGIIEEQLDLLKNPTQER